MLLYEDKSSPIYLDRDVRLHVCLAYIFVSTPLYHITCLLQIGCGKEKMVPGMKQ
jgi:hypothetical protein